MDSEIKTYIDSINEIRQEFEVFKMHLNLQKVKKQKIMSFFQHKDEEQKSLMSQELFQIY